MLLETGAACLLQIDLQQKLLPVMAEARSTEAANKVLQQMATTLNLPVLLTEQYPKGLGHTVEALRLPSARRFEKLTFSAWQNETIRRHLIEQHEAGRPLIILSGIEAHICVLQTAADLHKAGFGVFVVADAVSSRRQDSVDSALHRLRAMGVSIVNLEMVVFELLGRAGTPEFKTLSALIR